MNQDNKTTYNISVSEKESNAVAGFETCPNEKAFTSAPLCDVRSGEGCQRRGEVKPHSQLPIPDSLKMAFYSASDSSSLSVHLLFSQSL